MRGTGEHFLHRSALLLLLLLLLLQLLLLLLQCVVSRSSRFPPRLRIKQLFRP